MPSFADLDGDRASARTAVPPAASPARDWSGDPSAVALASAVGNRAMARMLARAPRRAKAPTPPPAQYGPLLPRTLRPTWVPPTLTDGAVGLGADFNEVANWTNLANDIDGLGGSFVGRYLSHSPSKNLTRAEANYWALRDVDLVVVWETTEKRPLSGKPGGRADAQAAQSQAAQCGMPNDAPIYFAVDFDADPKDIYAYFDGIADVLPLYRIGAYGGYRVIDGLFNTTRITYAWQAKAWSTFGGKRKWHRWANLRQIDGPAIRTASGQEIDRDLAMTGYFGQWRP